MQEQIKEFEKAEKPFELLKTKTEGILKSGGTAQEKMEQIKMLNTAFEEFLKNTKRKDVKEYAVHMRLQLSESFERSAKLLFNTYMEKVFKEYGEHLMNAGVDVTALTNTVNETERKMGLFARGLRERVYNPEEYNKYINENLPSLMKQYEDCIVKTQNAFAKAEEVKEITTNIGSSFVALEATVLLTPLGAGMGLLGKTGFSGILSTGDVVLTETLRGKNISEISPSHLLIGFTIGAATPYVAETLAHVAEKATPKIADALETDFGNNLLRKLISGKVLVSKAWAKTSTRINKYTEKTIEYLIEITKTSQHIHIGEKSEH